MSQTIVKQPAAFVTELQLPVSRGEVAVVQPKLGHGDQLKAVRALARNARSEFEAVTYGKVGFNSLTKLQQFAKEYEGQTVGNWLGVAAVGSIASLIAGTVANNAAGATVGVAVLAVGAAVSVLSGPIVYGLRLYARHDQKKAEKRLVTLDGKLSEAIARFQTASGAEKAMLGATLLSWRDAMNAQKALEPRARAALDAAVKQYNALADADKARAVIYTALDQFIDTPKTMSVDDIRVFRETLAMLEVDERREVMAACIDIIKQSGRTLDYDASYELHLLEIDNDAQRAAHNAKEATAAFAGLHEGDRKRVSMQ